MECPNPSSEVIASHPAAVERLFVLWHDRRQRRFFVIAQLVRRLQSPRYEFRYLPGFGDARLQGLDPLLSFPDRDRVYTSDHLFPFFENRLMRKSRPDFVAYVQGLDLDPATANDIQILGRSGGERATDAFLLLPEPEPVSGDAGLCQLHFFAAGISRLRGDAWKRLWALQAGDALTYTDLGDLVHGDACVGRLPGHLRALLPPSIAGVTVVRRNAGPMRHCLLCRVSFRGEDPVGHLASAGGLAVAGEAAAERPRAFHGTRPVSPLLSALIEHLAEGNRPELPPLANPIGGTLLGRPLPQSEYRLTLDPARCLLQLRGTDHDVGLKLLGNPDGLPNEAYLDLADGSSVLETALATRGLSRDWYCDLTRWLWLAASVREWPVRYWVGVVPDAELDPSWCNLVVTTLSGQGLRGLHIEGEPSWTLLKLQTGPDAVHRSDVALIVEADPRRSPRKSNDQGSDPNRDEVDPRVALYEASNCFGLATGLKEPPLFLGYNEDLQIGAACVRALPVELAAIDEAGLPVRPLSPGRNQADRRWHIPFLHCMRQALWDRQRPRLPDAILDGVIYFRWALEDPILPRELAQMGVAIRALLRGLPGAGLGDVDGLLPEHVNDALRRVAATLRLRLPEGATEALALSHRMALLGEAALQSPRTDVRSFWNTGQWEREREALRGLFATLLAGAIRYYGPVVGRLNPIRSWSASHDPWLDLDAPAQQQRAEQQAQADVYFSVGDDDEDAG